MDELTIKFPNRQELDLFVGWLADSGGEWDFMKLPETTVVHFDYRTEGNNPVIILMAFDEYHEPAAESSEAKP